MAASIPTSRVSGWSVHAVGGGVCILLLLAGYVLGIRPMGQEMVGEVGLEQQLTEAEANLRMHAAELERANEQARLLQSQIDTQPLNLQPVSSLNHRIGRVSNLAEQCELSLNKTKVGDLINAGEHAYIPVEIGGVGPFIKVSQMLGELHRVYPDMAVQGFELMRDPAGGEARFDLKLIWFVSEGVNRSAAVEAP